MNWLEKWRGHTHSGFAVGDIVIAAPRPQVSRNVRKTLRKNEYEAAEIYLVRQLVRPGDTVLDLGSGLALTAIAAAKASGTGRVVSYEADPVIAPLAENNVRKNRVRVEIRNKAIGKEAGVCEFHVHRNFTASSFLPFKGSKKIMIPADAFHQVVEEIQPAVIISDIEGLEGEVFENADLSPVQRLVVEVHPQIIGLVGVLKCVQTLTNLGFSLIEPLCVGQVLVFDRDGSSGSVKPFQPDSSRD